MGQLRGRVSMADVVRAYVKPKPGPVTTERVHEIRRRVIIEGEKMLAVAVDMGLSLHAVRAIAHGRRRANVLPDAQLSAWLREREGQSG